MPKLPRLSGKELVAIFERLGFVSVRQKGSHLILRKEVDGEAVGCVVPLHKELATGTLHGILRQAKIDTETFLGACKK